MTTTTQTFRLEATKGNLSSAVYIGFLSDTPVVLTLVESYVADLNMDGKVDILDIAIVAAAYYSKLRDQNWNALADIDKNGVINILDISMIAKDYGKIV